jgi:type I restriction enzyme S subunit
MKWEKKTINEVCKVGDGAHASIKRTADGFQYLTSKNFKLDGLDLNKVDFISEEDFFKHFKDDSKAITKPKSNDVLLSIIGSLGAPYLVKEDDVFGLSSSVSILRPKNEIIEPRFLFYWIKSNEFQSSINNIKSGVAQSFLSLGMIKSLPVIYPVELPTQRKIASILSAYDDLIENNLKRIKLLEEKAFASYKLIVNSEKLFEGKVGDLADVKSGYAFKSRDWTDEGFPVIKIKNIGNNDIELTDCSFIPESIAEAAHKFKLNAGDLLIAMTGATVGKIGMMPKTETSFYLNQRVGIFKPKVENAELFLFCFFNEPTAKNAVESLASGAAQPNISGGQLESIKLFYPKVETFTDFGNSIKSHFELIWNLKEQNTKLREARDILLPKLMNGQIDV